VVGLRLEDSLVREGVLAVLFCRHLKLMSLLITVYMHCLMRINDGDDDDDDDDDINNKIIIVIIMVKFCDDSFISRQTIR